MKMTPEQYRAHQERVGREMAARDRGESACSDKAAETPGSMRSKREKKGKRVPLEHDEQKAFIEWFRLAHPGVVIFAIPNGGSRHPAEAARLKQSGVLSGVPDLFIPAWKMWIEMKRKRGGRLSQSQADMMVYLRNFGYTCLVAEGCDDAVHLVTENKPTQPPAK